MKLHKVLFFILGFMFITITAWAAPSVAAINSRIDDAIVAKDWTTLRNVLEENKDSSSYVEIEKNMISKAKQLIKAKKLEEAQSLTLVIVDCNLDNMEAAKLYDQITKSIEKNNTEAQKQEEKEQLKGQKEAEQKTKILGNASKNYTIMQNEKTGENLYLDQSQNLYYRPFIWDVRLALFDLGLLSGGEHPQLKYGIGFGSNVYYYGEHFRFGGEVAGDAFLLSMCDDKTLNAYVKGVVSVGYAQKTMGIQLRGGYYYNVDDLGAKEENPEKFTSAVIGIGLRDIPFGKRVMVDAYADYFPGHLLLDNIKLAGEAGINLYISLVKFDDFSVLLNAGAKTGITWKNAGFFNQSRFTIAIGVGNNE